MTYPYIRYDKETRQVLGERFAATPLITIRSVQTPSGITYTSMMPVSNLYKVVLIIDRPSAHNAKNIKRKDSI